MGSAKKAKATRRLKPFPFTGTWVQIVAYEPLGKSWVKVGH